MSEEAAEEPRLERRPLRWGLLAMGLAGIAVAHAPLLEHDPAPTPIEGIEQALFEPTSASPILVLLCWAWFMVARWPRLRGFEGCEAPLGGSILLLCGAGVCLWAHYTGVPTLLIPSLSILVLGTGLLFGGMGALRTLLFPSFFLLFALPVPTPIVNGVMYSMQLANAAMVGAVLETVGLTPFVSGDLIFVGERLFQVIESCSGLRTILIVVVSALVFTQLAWHDRRRTLVLIALAPFIGVLANHLRILTIIFNPYATIATIHTIQGLIMLVFAVAVLGLADWLLARFWKTPAEPHLPAEVPRGRLPLSVIASHAVIGLSLAVAALSLSPWRGPAESLEPLVTIRGDLPAWQVKGFEPDQQFLGSIRFDEFIAHRYQHAEEPWIELLVAGDARLDPMLGIGSEKSLIPGAGGVRIETDRALGAPRPEMDAAIVRMPGEQQLVYHWKVGLDSRWIELYRTVLGLDRSPFRRPGRAAFVRLSTPIERTEAGLTEAIDRLERFTRHLEGDLRSAGVWPITES